MGNKKSKNMFNATIWSNATYPITSYINVKVFIDGRLPGEFDELCIEAVIVKYMREKAEVYYLHQGGPVKNCSLSRGF
ncbi:MAG: hypothetical protein QXJ69_05680 [Desulfurococcaceae archaeon]